MEIFLVWIGLTFLIGFIGSSRSCGFATAFFVSLFLSPIGGILILAFSKDKSIIEPEKIESNGLYSYPKLSDQKLETAKSEKTLMELGRLQLLLDSGMITNEEYSLKKKTILLGS